MDEAYFACAPLAEWISELAPGPRALACLDSLPRSLRGSFRDWDAFMPTLSGLSLLVVVGEAGPEDCVAMPGALRPGGWLVELRPLARSWARTLLTLGMSSSQVVAIGHGRAHQWIEAGLCGVQQWASLDPSDLLVTCGRKR